MGEKIQILYCHDKEGKEVYYANTIKDEIYYCIDCGAELIVREGKINNKHLAHKNTDNCSGTGESVIHKHWKENLFKEGMTINVANSLIEGMKECNVEILKVLNEVSLKKRYETDWDRDIIVDILLETSKGDIVVEINHTNKKDWDELSSYYDTIDVFKIYEVTVGRNVNDGLKWFGVKEKEEAEKLKEEIREKKRQQEKENLDTINEMLRRGIFERFNVFVNKHNELKVGKGTPYLRCLRQTLEGKLETITLTFDEYTLGMKLDEIQELFNIKSGIMQFNLIARKFNIGQNEYSVQIIVSKTKKEYDSTLYSKLCNI